VIAPAAILLYFFWVRDRWDREPLKVLLTLFGAGCLSVIPAAIIEMNIQWGAGISTIGQAFFTAFIVAALVEELVKFAFVYLLTFRSTYFREEYDGIIYAVAVGLGFAFFENIGYAIAAFAETGDGFFTVIARAFTAVPSHALDGVIMGFFIGRAHFTKDVFKRRNLYIMGIFLAILFHGMYDFFAFLINPLPSSVQGWCVVGLIWIIIVQWGTAHRFVRIAQRRSSRQWGFKLHPTSDDLAFRSEEGVKVEIPRQEERSGPITRAKSAGIYCRHCGHWAGSDADFCSECGSKIS